MIKIKKSSIILFISALLFSCSSAPENPCTGTGSASVAACAQKVSGNSPKFDVAAIIWPAYQNEPRWKELGIFAHGCGEWQNVYEGKPRFEGHYQPMVPYWGYGRDDDSVEVARQIDAALAAGINVFMYDWYWYCGRPFLENALNNGFLKAPNNARMHFYLMWANHGVTNLWNNKIAKDDWSNPIWKADVDYNEFTKVLVPRWIEYFKKPNYYKIDGKPVFMIYLVNGFVKGIGGVENAKKALEYFRRSLALTNSHPEMEFERNLTMVNLGEVFMLMNQTDSASCYLDRCRRFFMENKNLSALYYIDTQMIELALKQGNTSRARHLLSLTKDTEGVELNMIRIRNRYLQHYFEAVGNWRNAYEYQKLNWEIDDSVRNERIKMRSAEIALKYKRDSTLMKQELFIEQKENQVLSLYQWLWGIIVGVLLLGCGALALVFHRKRQREMEQTRLHTAITSLRLENIRNRISPHFIFNLLNREMNLRGDESKNRNLMNLTKLLRRNLELTDKLAVTLADELDFVNTYVALERSALGSDFEFVQEVDSKILPDKVLLPAMMLQIPVENAIKHGLRMKEGKKWLKISLKRRDDVIVMKVCDNGGGYRNRSANRGTGTGMKVITQTIQLLNFYNRRPIVMGITNLQVDDDGTMGCEVKYEVPLDYSYTLKKME